MVPMPLCKNSFSNLKVYDLPEPMTHRVPLHRQARHPCLISFVTQLGHPLGGRWWPVSTVSPTRDFPQAKVLDNWVGPGLDI